MTIHFPFDAGDLLRRKKALKREWSAREGLLEKRIAILGGSTTDEVANMLELCLLARGIKPVFYQSAYGQYVSEALQPEPALRNFSPDMVYLHTSAVNISAYPAISDTREQVETLLEQQLAHFSAVWNGISQNLGCTMIQNNIEQPWQRPLGNLDGSDYRGRSRFVARLNESLADNALLRHDVIIHDIHYLAARIGLDRWFNPRQWYLYKYAMDMEAIVHLAWQLAGVIAGIFGLSGKCLVLDLDNTLWGGVIGDDGIEGIAIGSDSATSEAHSDLQRYALALKERGVLLAVCSKNDESNARAGFLHPASILHADDFGAFAANWDDKPENILRIAKQLNIRTDSLVFLDDNPAERALVQQQLPTVTVPDIGSDITDFIQTLDHAALFETPTLSADDLLRAQQYRENHERASQASQFTDYDSFLRSLAMQAVIEPFCEKNLERITQLTNKTNQFNLTTRRCTLAEIQKMASDKQCITLTGRLSDKFGDNGLVSVVAGHIEGHTLHIDLWLMSCRVLKRGLEYAMLSALCQQATAKGLDVLQGYFFPSGKNSMVEGLYRDLGFSLLLEDVSQSVWQFQLDNISSIPAHFIHINNGNPS